MRGLLVLSLLLLGCANEHYRVVVRFEDEALAARVDRIELSLGDPCALQPVDGSAPAGVWRQVELRRGDPYATLGEARVGTFGLVGRGFAPGCEIAGLGCTDVALDDGGGGDLAVVLASITATGCPAGEACIADRCEVVDGGMPDGGPGPSDATIADGGGTDGGEPPCTVLAGVVSGGQHTCIVRPGGTLACSGFNAFGQLGLGDTTDRLSFTDLEPDPWMFVSEGTYNACAIPSDSSLWCWGLNARGNVGIGAGPDVTRPTRVGADTWATVAVADMSTCAIASDGALFCWGDNTWGQLGLGDMTSREMPTRVGLDDDWSQISGRSSHFCAIRTDGSIWCWGSNLGGQLGTLDYDPRAVPTLASTGPFRTVAAGGGHTCALTTAGERYCWGANGGGQLGFGTTSPPGVTLPMPAGDGIWDELDTGFAHSCERRGTRVECWGWNMDGQLGQSDTMDRPSPTPLPARAWREVSLGERHSCAIEMDGQVWCWGVNNEGQLGNGTMAGTSTPQRVCL